jgi:hypothetical protein
VFSLKKGGKEVNGVNLHEEILTVARNLFERSGQVEGRDLDNWLNAERLVMARYKQQEKLMAETPTPKKGTSTTKRRITRKFATKI